MKISRKVVPDLRSMKTTCVSFLMGPHRKRMIVSFLELVEFRVEYFRVSSSLLDHVKVELKSPKLEDRPRESTRHEPDSGPHADKLVEPENY